MDDKAVASYARTCSDRCGERGCYRRRLKANAGETGDNDYRVAGFGLYPVWLGAERKPVENSCCFFLNGLAGAGKNNPVWIIGDRVVITFNSHGIFLLVIVFSVNR